MSDQSPKGLTAIDLLMILTQLEPSDLIKFEDSDYGESTTFAVYKCDGGIVFSDSYPAERDKTLLTNTDAIWFNGKRYADGREVE